MTQLPHLHLVGGMDGVRYSRPQTGFAEFWTPPRDRVPHANNLRASVSNAVTEGIRELQAQGEDELALGLTFVVESHVNYNLQVGSLENRRKGIKLLSVTSDGGIQRAVIFVPRAALDVLLKRIDEYEKATTKKGVPKNAPLINSIERIRLAIAEDMWTEPTPFPNVDASIWWEVWIPRDRPSPEDDYNELADTCRSRGLEVNPRWLEFSERLVTLVKARPSDWGRSRALLEKVAELRSPSEPITPYLNLAPREQADWVRDLRVRLRIAHPSAPAVCLLDTGVHRGHPLLQDSLLEADWQAVSDEWGSQDNDEDAQHGTLMAGTALFEDLAQRLSEPGPVVLRHRLESVRIFPRRGANQPDLYGEITKQAVSKAEIAAPQRQRVICLATTTAVASGAGAPSSWSAAIDQVAYNSGDVGRLVCVSAGNIREHQPPYQYLVTNCSTDGQIEDPAQAWNALTVGSFTSRTQLSPTYAGWAVVAPQDGLSPTSRTTASWDSVGSSPWPLKPDIVFEGGNLITDGNGQISPCPETEMLTTGVRRSGALFDCNSGTSAAVAQAAKLAAEIAARYPTLWAESVRALIYHSAEWTAEMRRQSPGEDKAAAKRRVRLFGHGVPNRERALSSLANAVTLISESAIQPYMLNGSAGKHNQMGLHRLPWPTKALLDLGEVPVKMRVTLSYFIDPNPGRRGNIPKTRYASHGLRFDVRRPGEGIDEFQQRLSAAMREDDDGSFGATDDERAWVLGVNARGRGSLQGDWWEGSASQLAQSDAIAVYPVTGWWKERPFLKRVENTARYSLVVSIESPPESIDLYTMITTQTEIPVEVVAED